VLEPTEDGQVRGELASLKRSRVQQRTSRCSGREAAEGAGPDEDVPLEVAAGGPPVEGLDGMGLEGSNSRETFEG
jgi:hypothetical protein